MNKEKYRVVKEPRHSTLYTVQNMEYKWGVVDQNDNVIVEFGKYNWIGGFQNGLAKVIGHKDNTSSEHIVNLFDDTVIPERTAEQGVINEAGEEVIDMQEGYIIWKFYEKDFSSIVAVKDGEKTKFTFGELNPDLVEEKPQIKIRHNYDDDYDDTPSYRELLEDSWDAMTDGQYGDMPEGFDGDFDFLGR